MIDDEKVRVYIDRGDELTKQGQYDEAIAEYTQAIKVATDDETKAQVYRARGRASYKKARADNGDYAEAIADYTQAIRLATDDNTRAEAYRNKGTAYFMQEKYTEAIAEYTQAIKVATDDETKAQVYRARGRAFYKKARADNGDYAEAIADYTQAIRLATDDNTRAEAYRNKGTAYFMQEKYTEAIKDYTQAINLAKDNNIKAKAHYGIGYVYRGQKQDDEAIAEYTQAIKLATNDNTKARAYHGKGDVYFFGKKEYDEAITEYTQAIKLATDNKQKGRSYHVRAWVYDAQEKYTEAIEEYTEAIKLEGYHYKQEAYYDRAKAHYYKGITNLKDMKYEDAIDDLKSALQYSFNKDEKQIEQDGTAKSILAVFESTAEILETLKVTKDNDDTIQYLSHTTKLSVFKQLVSNKEKSLGSFCMYHIAYANDPTEGEALFNKLDISPDKATRGIPYVMVASFCGGKNLQALDSLPIWKMYGDDAQGIGLLFKKSDIAHDKPGHVGTASRHKDFAKDSRNTKNINRNEAPPQILYEVHYVGSDIKNEKSKNIDEKSKNIDEKSKNIDKNLKNIKEALDTIKQKEDIYNIKQKEDIYNKTLELLNGVRYLIKDANYAYEQEYRLLCFANGELIPKILQRKDSSEQTEKTEDTNTGSGQRIYMETEILKKLYKVITAPKVEKKDALNIQYSLHFYKHEKNEFPKLDEKEPLHTSKIPYR